MGVYAFKFLVRGTPLAGKFLFRLEEDSELYLDHTFQPYTPGSEHICFFLKIKSGRTWLQVLKPGFELNGQPAPERAVELRSGSKISHGQTQIEILHCPEAAPVPWQPKPLPKAPEASGQKSEWEDRGTQTQLLSIEPKKHAADPLPSLIPSLIDEPGARTKEIPALPKQTSTPRAGIAVGFGVAFFAGLAVGVGAQPMLLRSAERLGYLQQEISLPVAAQAEAEQMPGPPLAQSAIADAAPAEAVADSTAPPMEGAREPASLATETPEAGAEPTVPVLSETERAAFFAAVDKNNLEEVRSLADRVPSIDSLQDEQGRTPLLRAASLGHVKMIQFFLEKQANVNAQDVHGNTALMLAVEAAREKTALTLLQAGASPAAKRADGATAITIAQAKKNGRILKRLESSMN